MNQNKRPRLQFDDSSADDSGSASSRFVPPTRNCGIDSGHCNRMDREGRPSGIISALQCIGRIRPHL